jgi:mannan endo-1,6-alpha-mannosidase
MYESACETAGQGGAPTCNTDQRSFKAYLSRFMAHGYQLVPDSDTRDFIMQRLKASAVAAGKACNGGDDGNTCGLAWRKLTYDGSPYGIAKGGVGEHMAAMELFQSLLIEDSPELKTVATGTSQGDPSAGTGNGLLTEEDLMQTKPSTKGDRAGAGLLTTVVLGVLLGLTYWLIKE